MKIKMTLTVLLLICSCFAPAVFPQGKTDIKTRPVAELIKDFSSEDWFDTVVPAEKELESRQADIIPEIIKLLDRDEKATLKNTADLIYPGATMFFGHGWVMDYDVDWINVRAGWLLEELTFQSFGFREGLIDHDEILMTVIKGKSDSYLKELSEKQKSEVVRKQARMMAVQKAKIWWQNVKKPWKRFDTIYEGLKGNDIALQYEIFQWLRHGDTKCDGLTPENFDKILLPEVERLAKSDNKNISDEAKMLIDSNNKKKEKWWYRYKLKRDYPDRYSTMELK